MIAVLDYGIGNLRSAEKALQKAGGDARLVTSPDEAAGAAGVVLPGVGAFGRCMQALHASGMDQVVLDAVDTGTPFLGICVGLQMLYEGSDENPEAKGLGILPGRVEWLPPGQKRPQMQWNRLEMRRPSGLFDGLGDEVWMYFLHSFAAPDGDDVVAVCDYGGPVAAAVDRDGLWAVQFHPEKSGRAGLGMLANFVRRCGSR